MPVDRQETTTFGGDPRVADAVFLPDVYAPHVLPGRALPNVKRPRSRLHVPRMKSVSRSFAVLAVLIASLSCNPETQTGPSSQNPENVATQLGTVAKPTAAISGIPFDIQPVIHVLDANAQLFPSTAAVTASVTGGNVTLVGTLTVNAVNGVATFTDLQVNGGGAFTLSFVATGLSPTSFSLAAKQRPKLLSVLTQPDGAETGLPFTRQPIVRLLDDAFVPVRDTNFVVAARVENGSGTLLGTATASSLNGVASFTNLAISGSGAHSLQFTAGILDPTSSNDFLVLGATSLVVVQQPDSASLNTNFARPAIVELRGASNTVMRGASNPVTATVNSGDGTLAGTMTVTPVLGVATFTTLRLNARGKHTLAFSVSGLPAVRSDTFTVRSPPVALLQDTIPDGAVSGNVLTTQPVIVIADGANQRVSDATATVTVSMISGSATLSGTTTVTAVGGVARFTNLRLDGSGSVTLRFVASGLTQTTATVNVTQTPASLAVVTHANGAGTGVPFTTQPVVRVLDQAGLVVGTATTPVTAAVNTGTGTLSGTTTVNAAGGIARFTDLAIVGGGPHTLSFSAPGLASVLSASFVVSQTAVGLAVTTQPAGATRDAPFVTQPKVEVRDGANGLVRTSVALVTATVASGSGALAGTMTVAAVNGVATFTNLRVNAEGPHSLSFSSTLLASTTSAVFAVTGLATTVAITTEPAGAVSGLPLATQPVVQLRDVANQVAIGSTAAVTAAITSGSGTLVGTTTVNAVEGVARFTDLRIDGAGAHTLSFTSTGLTGATSGTVTVGQGAVSLAMQTQPVGAETGQPLGTQPVVRVLDNAGLQLATGTTSVTASIASGTGTLTGTTTVAAVNGLVTFTNLAVVGGGAHTLQFSAAGLTGTTATPITIVQTPVSLGIDTPPGGATVNLVLTTPPAIQIRDALNNVVDGSTASVTVAVASGPGALSGTTVVNAVNGVATFDDLVFSAPGLHTLSFASGGLTPVTSSVFVVSLVPSKLSVQTQPAGAVSGLLMTTPATVRVLDAADDLAGGFTGPITVTIATGTGALSGTLTLNAVGGIVTFPDLSIAGAGSHTLTFTSAGLTSITSDPFTVTQNAFELTIETQPGGSVSGSTLTGQPVITVRDNAGLRILSSTHAVTAVMAGVGNQPATGTLLGTTTVNAVQGEATFTNLRVDGGGSHALAFGASGVPSIVSASFVTTQNATTLVMDREPAGATSGVAFATQPRIRVEDVTQNLVLGATTAITASIASGTGTLNGTTTVNAVNGVATFTNLSIAGSGAHTLTFAATGLASATSTAITVGQAPASIGMFTQPAGAVSGLNLTTQPVVRILDSGGLLVSGATNTVTVSLASGTGTLVGTTSVNAVNGVATFTNLRINGAGAHTLRFASTGLTSTTSATVTVTQEPASLMMETQPGGAFTGVPFVGQPRIRILDHAGLQIAGATNAVTVAVASGPGVLTGTLTVNAVAGLATFSGLAITGEGLHALSFTSGALASTTSANFQVLGPEQGGESLIHPSCAATPTPSVPTPLRVFFVDAINGDDARLGTSLATAWKTLGRANNALIAGDLVYMRGVFSGQDIKPLNSGTETNKIVYRALPGDSARITLGAGGVAISFSGRSHVVVDNIAITGVLTPILIRNSAHHIWLFNLRILDGGTNEINNSDDNWIDRTLIQRTGALGAAGDAILIRNGADRNFITRNTFREAGRAGVVIGPTSATDVVALDNQILQNTLQNPWGTGMILGPRSQGAVLECNRVHESGAGSTAQSGLDVDGVEHQIRYNEVFQNALYGILLRGKTFPLVALPAVTSTLTDNTIWGNTIGSIAVMLTFTP